LYLSNLTIAGALHNVLYVTTEHGSAYAFDADTGAIIWQVSVLANSGGGNANLGGVFSAGGVFASPAYFNNTLYYGSTGDSIKAFAIANATLTTLPSSQTGNRFPYPGATPGISANGSSGAILWAVENGATAVLHAYDATNLSNELEQLDH